MSVLLRLQQRSEALGARRRRSEPEKRRRIDAQERERAHTSIAFALTHIVPINEKFAKSDV